MHFQAIDGGSGKLPVVAVPWRSLASETPEGPVPPMIAMVVMRSSSLDEKLILAAAAVVDHVNPVRASTNLAQTPFVTLSRSEGSGTRFLALLKKDSE